MGERIILAQGLRVAVHQGRMCGDNESTVVEAVIFCLFIFQPLGSREVSPAPYGPTSTSWIHVQKVRQPFKIALLAVD